MGGPLRCANASMVVLWNACKEVGGKTHGMKLRKFHCYLFGTVGRDAKALHTHGAISHSQGPTKSTCRTSRSSIAGSCRA